MRVPALAKPPATQRGSGRAGMSHRRWPGSEDEPLWVGITPATGLSKGGPGGHSHRAYHHIFTRTHPVNTPMPASRPDKTSPFNRKHSGWAVTREGVLTPQPRAFPGGNGHRAVSAPVQARFPGLLPGGAGSRAERARQPQPVSERIRSWVLSPVPITACSLCRVGRRLAIYQGAGVEDSK